MVSHTTCRGGNYVSPIALCGAPVVPNGVRQAPLQLIGCLSACELVSLIKCPHLLSRSVESPAKSSAEEWGKERRRAERWKESELLSGPQCKCKLSKWSLKSETGISALFYLKREIWMSLSDGTVWTWTSFYEPNRGGTYRWKERGISYHSVCVCFIDAWGILKGWTDLNVFRILIESYWPER